VSKGEGKGGHENNGSWVNAARNGEKKFENFSDSAWLWGGRKVLAGRREGDVAGERSGGTECFLEARAAMLGEEGVGHYRDNEKGDSQKG